MYRNYRNLEASLIDQITSELITDKWKGIRVEKSFVAVYKGTLPCICINEEDSDPTRREIGSNSYIEPIRISIRIFTKTDGHRLDLASWLISKLFPGFIYYEYIITDGVVSSKVPKGRINILRIINNRKELVNTEKLEQIDKCRHLITFECRVALS